MRLIWKAVKWACLVAVIALAAPEVWSIFVTSHPVEDGSRLRYRVIETDLSGASRSYQMDLHFAASANGALELEITNPHGSRVLLLGREDLLFIWDPERDDLEFPTESGTAAKPLQLWLPPDRRVAGMNCRAGLVEDQDSFAGRRVRRVMHPDGTAYYAVDHGLLVGFEFEFGRTKLVGKLRGIQQAP